MRRRNAALPEDPWRYFTHPTDAVLVPISSLQPIRARPTGIENARKHMRAAYDGAGKKRAPISISADGRVLDGNSTYAVAKASGWASIPAVITEDASHNPFSMDDFGIDDAEDAKSDPLDELQSHLGIASAMDPSEFLRDTGLLAPSTPLYFFRSSPAWSVRIHARNEDDAKAKGKRVFKALKGKRSVAAHVPHVHDLPLYVIYNGSWVRVGPSAIKPLSTVARSKADQKRDIVLKGEATFGSRSIRITGSEGAYKITIHPTLKELRVFKDGVSSAPTLKGLDAKLDEAIAAVEKWRAQQNPRARNATKSVSRADYPAVFGDTDADSFPDVDDPRPRVPGDVRSIEEVRLSDEIGALIDAREQYVPAMDLVIDRLKSLGIPGAKVQGRVKTPYSMINKLRRKRLQTLTDVAGTRIVVPDQEGLQRVQKMIEKDFEVLQKEDFYATPQAGYRAVHYIVKTDGVPVEVQVKTQRMSEIANASHTAYKRGDLDVGAMERLTSLAAKADRGDRRAQTEIDALLQNKQALRRALARQPNPSHIKLARRIAAGGR